MRFKKNSERQIEDAIITYHAIGIAVEAVGAKALKALQHEVIRSFTEGNDVFESLPTGYGKSLCFVCLPLASQP